ncbi:ABC transporter ATP-binding protein [Rhizobium sp. AQ_MP]|uniref:ATP-binding cassette domain-containing protein n=1 Tax=Rhizobium sp. AQ_MP TaxID=2761536 RepID=UPI00163A053C|nr:ABC transporter ATP-binding protein [Rhizobium sp. AQ_MP]MBC2775546.1 ABC transporter ATP-binding protein [Rhizobium sp. AQ_MP]
MNAAPASLSPLSGPPTGGREPLLRVERLNVWYGARDAGSRARIQVLHDVSFDLMPGERLGLIGESGSGKTTIASACMGLLASSAEASGRILLEGRNILADGEASVAPHRWKDIAMVFQGAMNAFNPVRSIGWQIAEAMEVQDMPRGRFGLQRVGELLELVGIPAAQATSYAHEFSGGMRQRAMIAMALACSPKVLLADEPTTALDVMVQRQVLDLLVDLSRKLDLGVILVTHDLGVVAEACTRAVVMLNGRAVETGPTADLFHRPTHAYTAELLKASPRFETRLKDGAAGLPPVQVSPRMPLLTIDGLTVDYAQRPSFREMVTGRRPAPRAVVKRLDLTVAAGELVALVGRSGCGKTSTLQSVMRMQPSSAGRILFDGQDITALKGRALRRVRRDIQMIYQDPYESLDSRFRVVDTVMEPLEIHGIGSSRAERMSLVRQALERVGLTPVDDFLRRYPHELSGGQRQRVAIAAGVVLSPKLILADEPTSMLDVSIRSGILDLLVGLCREGGLSVLMITHDLSTAASYADRIAVMHEGRIIEEGPALDIALAPKAQHTRDLLAAVPRITPETTSQA